MFFLETKNKEDCYGCGACGLICPCESMIMIEDEEGFAYPQKSEESCKECGCCKKVCPNISKSKITERVYPSKAYLAIHRDEEIVNKSSSGGVFSALTSAFFGGSYKVFGVEFDKDLNVKHSWASDREKMAGYRKSKYVFSDMGNSYEEAKAFLDAGEKVLFTGVPCQIAGLKLYLGKEVENLLCGDVICHGAPSQKVFDWYIKYLENKHKGRVSSFTFRHKTYSWFKGWNSRNVKYSIGEESFIYSSTVDPYLRGYHEGLFYRPSCYTCKYANPVRVSDITMADFWGVDELFPTIDVHKGCSVLLANTKKGQEWVNQLEAFMTIKEVGLRDVIIRNRQLREPAKKHQGREMFFSNLGKKDFKSMVKRCIPKEQITLRKTVVKLMPYKMKKMIKKLRNKSK